MSSFVSRNAPQSEEKFRMNSHIKAPFPEFKNLLPEFKQDIFVEQLGPEIRQNKAEVQR
jgi:hypothetical protein